MLGVYKELVRLHKEEALDFSRVVTFNLDEYLGLAADHLESFHYFMRENFFAHVNIRPGNTHIPDGKVSGNYEKYCADYEKSIRKSGESIFKSWASGAMATWVSTNRPRAWPRELA